MGVRRRHGPWSKIVKKRFCQCIHIKHIGKIKNNDFLIVDQAWTKDGPRGPEIY